MSIRELARTVDERLADLGWAGYILGVEKDRVEDDIRLIAGQKRDWSRGTWNGTLDEALETELHYPYMGQRRDEAKARLDRIRDTLAQIGVEFRELNAVYLEEQWNRAFLVKNSNGHVHSTQDCSTCFESTSFAWLTEFSGADEAEIVEAAGETACTVCYPSAPAEVLNRPTTIVTAEKAAKEAAKAEREAKRAEREAKRKANAPTASGESLWVPSDWREGRTEEIKTERTAVSEWYSAEDMKSHHPEDAAWCARYQARQDVIEEALAEKHGVSVEEKRAELLAKYAKRK